MIELKNLSKNYGALTVLENVSAVINNGEIISVIGPSGCGKSTLLRCLNLLEKPSGGEIIVDGEDFLAKGANVNSLRRKMGMVFQSFNLYSHLMIIENIMLAPIKLLKMPRQEAFDEGLKYLDMVGLSQKAYSYPDELSGGQKQRAAIARTLAMKPEIILFDEPTSALDPTMVSEVLAVIRKLAQEGLTMMIVTHEMKFARDVSSRVFYMDEKDIYEHGTPAQIFDNPQRPKTRAFINKTRCFSCSLEGKAFDLFELSAGVEEFLKKQLFTDKKIRTVQLISEELLCNILPDVTIDYSIEYSEATEKTRLMASFGGDRFDPIVSDTDDLSMTIVIKMSENVEFRFEGGINHVEITA